MWLQVHQETSGIARGSVVACAKWWTQCNLDGGMVLEAFFCTLLEWI